MSRASSLFVFGLAMASWVGFPSSAALGARVGEGVADVLEAQDRVQVPIAFRVADEVGARKRKAAVSAARDRILRAVPPQAFSPTLVYRFVPAVRGYVTTERLATLVRDRDVIAIDIPKQGSQQLGQSVPPPMPIPFRLVEIPIREPRSPHSKAARATPTTILRVASWRATASARSGAGVVRTPSRSHLALPR